MDVKRWVLLTFAYFFIVLASGNECRIGCYFNNTLYTVNQIFNDGCNNCQCTEKGAVCGKMFCGKPVKSAELGCFCGEFYPVGKTFVHSDGCNKCTCGSSGVICSKMYCEQNPEERLLLPVTSECSAEEVKCSDGSCISRDRLCKGIPGSVCTLDDYNIHCNSAVVLSSTLGLFMAICSVIFQLF